MAWSPVPPNTCDCHNRRTTLWTYTTTTAPSPSPWVRVNPRPLLTPYYTQLQCNERPIDQTQKLPARSVSLRSKCMRMTQQSTITFNISESVLVKVKVSSYTAQYPILRLKARYTLLPWQTCSIRHHLNFYGKHPAMLQVMREGCSYTYPLLPIAFYFIVQRFEHIRILRFINSNHDDYYYYNQVLIYLYS